jgi:hypothetical protein
MRWSACSFPSYSTPKSSTCEGELNGFCDEFPEGGRIEQKQKRLEINGELDD